MINFKGNEGIIFNFRSAAVIEEDGYILIHKSMEEKFWSLPGGRVEFGEETDSAVIRELKEELNLEGKVKRLLWFAEDFYSYKEEEYHEICTYYLVEPLSKDFKDKEKIYKGLEGNKELVYKWVEIKLLEEIEIYPIILRDKLRNIPKNIEKIVIKK